jgi:cysteine desulfurase
MVLRGVSHIARRTTLRNPKIIVSAIEHESILETAKDLLNEGIEIAYLPVDRRGVVDVKRLAELLDDRTVLVSIMHANNEVGTIEPVKDIAQMVGRYRKEKASSKNMSLYPLIHTDAAQTAQFLDCNAEDLRVDLMTLSSHKLYGPKGAAALYVREKNLLTPLVTGGGQEFGLRSGTENVPAIVGFAKAFELAASCRDLERVRIGGLKDKIMAGS